MRAVGSDYLKRGGDPEGFARSMERAQLGAENDADFDNEADYFRRRPSFMDDNDVNDEAEGGMGAGGGRMGAFGPLIGENPDYENDEFANRFQSDSVDSRDSLGNPRPKSGALLSSIMNIEGAQGHFGGFAGHRMPRQAKMASHVSDMSGTLGLSSSSSSASSGVAEAPRRRGFFNGSWNPFKWNWRNLFGRRR